MISFKKALDKVITHASILPPVEKNIYQIDSDVLAEDIKAKEDIPLFSNSAMDGFALRAEDTHSVPVAMNVKGCIKAGDSPRIKVGKGETVKIMTGAPLPEGANAVVMVEDTEEKEKKVFEKGERVKIHILPWK